MDVSNSAPRIVATQRADDFGEQCERAVAGLDCQVAGIVGVHKNPSVALTALINHAGRIIANHPNAETRAALLKASLQALQDTVSRNVTAKGSA